VVTARTAGLRLGLAVDAPSGLDGERIVRAAQLAVLDANNTGGVGGGAVTLTVVDAADHQATGRLGRTVDALVGGAGAGDREVPWLLADSSDHTAPPSGFVPGRDVRASPDPGVAGQALGHAFARRGTRIGAIAGDGADGALADGLADAGPTTIVRLHGSDRCDGALGRLAAARVRTIALAVAPAVAADCIAVLSHLAWRQSAALVVAPSFALDGRNVPPEVGPVYTALGVPPPDADTPGVRRLRDRLGPTSFDAMASVAAVDLAVEIARAAGSVTPWVTRGNWHTDLVELRGGSTVAQVAMLTPGGWTLDES